MRQIERRRNSSDHGMPPKSSVHFNSSCVRLHAAQLVPFGGWRMISNCCSTSTLQVVSTALTLIKPDKDLLTIAYASNSHLQNTKSQGRQACSVPRRRCQFNRGPDRPSLESPIFELISTYWHGTRVDRRSGFVLIDWSHRHPRSCTRPAAQVYGARSTESRYGAEGHRIQNACQRTAQRGLARSTIPQQSCDWHPIVHIELHVHSSRRCRT